MLTGSRRRASKSSLDGKVDEGAGLVAHQLHSWPRETGRAAAWNRPPRADQSSRLGADEPWVVDGAAVRVSLVCFSRADDESVVGPSKLDGEPVRRRSTPT